MARIPKKLPRDVNTRAVAIARILVDEDVENIDPRRLDAINEARSKASRAGRARASALPPATRRRIARKAAAVRWKKQ